MSGILSPSKTLRGEIIVPGDKSISHRSVMFGSISKGITEVSGFLDSADCRSTISCFRKMGVNIEKAGEKVTVYGRGLRGLMEPKDSLDVGNSGTTMRLISGILSGQNFPTVLTGDNSIKSRPMQRIIEPLSMMGANISSMEGGLAPLHINPGKLKGINYTLPVASAQVKSCVILAGLYAEGETTVREKIRSRDHTERMLSAFGADINVRRQSETASGWDITINPVDIDRDLSGTKVSVPGDISSAAYFIAAALIHPDAEILIKNVNVNPTRAGIIAVVKNMGGNIELHNSRIEGGEEVADILVRSSSLHGTVVEGDIIPTLIDELPMIAVMAAFANGKTIIRDASELKKKESDRIIAVTENLKSIGGSITPTDDGMIIEGGKDLHGGHIKTYDDHRIAMSFAVPSLLIPNITLDNPECVNISFENFYELLEKVKI